MKKNSPLEQRPDRGRYPEIKNMSHRASFAQIFAWCLILTFFALGWAVDIVSRRTGAEIQRRKDNYTGLHRSAADHELRIKKLEKTINCNCFP